MNIEQLIQEALDENNFSSVAEQINALFTQKFSQSPHLQAILEIDSATCKALYQKGYDLYETNPKRAKLYFRLLLILNPLMYPYWFSYGAVLQSLALYEEALKAYSIAALLQPYLPQPHLEACFCYLFLQERGEAKKAFSACLEKYTDEKNLVERMEQAKKVLF